MVWTIHIVKSGLRFSHIADELHAALAVACIFIRNGIAVDEIDGPDGEKIGAETIQELCADNSRATKWRRARLKFLSR